MHGIQHYLDIIPTFAEASLIRICAVCIVDCIPRAICKTCTSKPSCVVPSFEKYNRFMPLYLRMKLYPKKVKTTLICNFFFQF